MSDILKTKAKLKIMRGSIVDSNSMHTITIRIMNSVQYV